MDAGTHFTRIAVDLPQDPSYKYIKQVRSSSCQKGPSVARSATEEPTRSPRANPKRCFDKILPGIIRAVCPPPIICRDPRGCSCRCLNIFMLDLSHGQAITRFKHATGEKFEIRRVVGQEYRAGVLTARGSTAIGSPRPIKLGHRNGEQRSPR